MLINSSVLPVRDGALESSNGLAKGPALLIAIDSEDQLERLENVGECGDVGEANGESSSRYFPGRDLEFGGSNRSVDSTACPSLLQNDRCDAVDCKGLRGEYGCVSERPVVSGEVSMRMLSGPELSCT